LSHNEACRKFSLANQITNDFILPTETLGDTRSLISTNLSSSLKTWSERIQVRMNFHTFFMIVMASLVLTEKIHLKGNLLFSEIGGKSLNQEHMVFVRGVNTSDLEQIAQYLAKAGDLYYSFCDSVRNFQKYVTADNKIKAAKGPDKTFIVTQNAFLLAEANEACRRLSATIPEFKTIQELRTAHDLAITHSISQTRAGIYYDKKLDRFLFESDNSNARSDYIKISYGGSYVDATHFADWEDSSYLTKEAQSYMLTYQFRTDSSYIHVSDNNLSKKRNKVICQKIANPPSELTSSTITMLKYAENNCNRDYNRLNSLTKKIIQDITAVTNLNVTSTSSEINLDNYLPQVDTRTKRSIQSQLNLHKSHKNLHKNHKIRNKGSIANKTAINSHHDDLIILSPILRRAKRDIQLRHKRSLMSSMIKFGGFSIVGALANTASYAVRAIIDTLTRPRDIATKEDINKLGRQINSVRIGHNEVVTTINQVESKLRELRTSVTEIAHASIVMAMETDVKLLIQFLQNTLNSVLIKYSIAMLAAQDMKASPYVLSQLELEELAIIVHKESAHTIDTTMSNVKTTAAVVENTVIFIFEIPIIDTNKQYNFYLIKPIPVFKNNSTFYPDIDTTNIAISADGSRYVSLDQYEFDRCLDTPSVCNSHTPVAPVSNQALCTIVTYTTNQQKCPLKDFKTKPFVFLYFDSTNNRFFYSTPAETMIFIKCSEKDGSYEDKTYTINGIGQAEFKPDCSINLQDGTTFRTPQTIGRKQLSDLPLLQIKDLAPSNSSYKIIVSKDTKEQIMLSPIPAFTNDQDSSEMRQASPSLWQTILLLITVFFTCVTSLCMCRKRICSSFQAHSSPAENPTPNPYKAPTSTRNPYLPKTTYPIAAYSASTEDIFLSSLNKIHTPSILKKKVEFK
jgi:hypothetical protein